MKRLLLLLLLAEPGWAAVTFDAVSTSATTATNATNVSWNHTVGSGCTDALLWVAVTTQDDTTEAASTVTYNGDTVSFQDGGNVGAEFSYGSWYRKEPDKGSSFTITVTFPVSKNQILGTARSYCGVDQTTTFGTVAIQEGNDVPFTVNVTSATGELVIDMIVANDNVTSLTVGSGQTERSNLTAASNHIHATSEEAGAGTVAMSWTPVAGEYYAILGVSLKPAAAAGGSTVPIILSGRRRR